MTDALARSLLTMIRRRPAGAREALSCNLSCGRSPGQEKNHPAISHVAARRGKRSIILQSHAPPLAGAREASSCNLTRRRSQGQEKHLPAISCIAARRGKRSIILRYRAWPLAGANRPPVERRAQTKRVTCQHPLAIGHRPSATGLALCIFSSQDRLSA